MKRLLGAALLLSALSQNPSAAPAVMHFDWPVGITAHVETEYVREAGSEQRPQKVSSLRMTHTMKVLPHDGAILVQYTDQTHVDSSGEVMPAVARLLASLVPDRLVSPTGHFIAIDHAAQLRSVVKDMIEPQLADTGNVPELRATLEHLSSEEGLSAAARQEWDDLVGRWVDAPIGGEMREGRTSVPIAPGLAVPATVTSGMTARVNCDRGSRTYECAIYEIAFRLDRDAMTDVMKSMLEGTDGRPAMKLDSGCCETVARVTLETATMLPHELTLTRTLRGAFQFSGRTIKTLDVERQHTRFTYIPD